MAVDDFGTLINPMIVEGQVHGGIAQGIGQALTEACVYDQESGQLLTGSFMDYCMPRADDLPSFKLGFTETKCPSNPLGMKGCGEAGAIAAPAAVMNAITDALGVRDLPMPATPHIVWKAMQPMKTGGRIAAGGSKPMENFNYHRPASARRRGQAHEEGEGRQVHVGRHDAASRP